MNFVYEKEKDAVCFSNILIILQIWAQISKLKRSIKHLTGYISKEGTFHFFSFKAMDI